MKRFGLLCIFICLTVMLIPVVNTVSAVPTESQPANSWNTLDSHVSVLGNSKLIGNAEAVVLYEVKSDTLVYAWNADQQVYPASMVKILTALIAIEQGDLDAMVTAEEDVLKTVPYDAVTASLQDGETMSLKDLLYCMMVGSANDAAAVIAAHISGTQAAFVAEMNTYAQTLGCTGSNFTNVHGLHNKEQYTTARDVTRILVAAMKNEFFAELFGTTKYTVPQTNKYDARTLLTSNYLLSKDTEEIYIDDRVTGGRTGVTSDQKRCLAATSEQNGMQLISVVMGCASKYAADGYTVELYGGFSETTELLDRTFGSYRCAQVLFHGQVLRQRPVIGARNSVLLGPTSSTYAVLPLDITSADLTYHYSDLQQEFRVPIAKGDILSSVEVWYNGINVAQAQLQAMNTVTAVSFDDDYSQQKPDNGWIWWVILIVVGAVFAVFIVLAVLRRLNRDVKKAAAKKRSRGYRRSRRRSR